MHNQTNDERYRRRWVGEAEIAAVASAAKHDLLEAGGGLDELEPLDELRERRR